MAELAAGAVSSLLGVIRNEALLLGRVRHDVRFIQEEMESMKSFLAHLARRAPAGGEHDEQIRTWMNQVWLLALDCNNCIDLYLSRGNPEIHRARGGVRKYVWWLPWFVHKIVAQHRAAVQLRELRDRARDIGERQQRYKVEVPASVHAEATSVASGAEEESDDQLVVPTGAFDHSVAREAFFEPRTPEDNVRVKLAVWMKNVAQRNTVEGKSIPSVSIVVPDNKETRAIANEALVMGATHFTHSVMVDIPEVHFYFQALGTQDILYYILRELQPTESKKPQEEGQGKREGRDIRKEKYAISSDKLKVIDEITKNVQGMKIDKKILEIKRTIVKLKNGQLQLDLVQMNNDLLESVNDEPLGVLLRALWLILLKPAEGASAPKQGPKRKEAVYSQEDIIKETAKMLKYYMEKEVTEEKMESQEHLVEEENRKPIRLKDVHYEHILREVFPVTTWKPPQIREKDSKEAPTVAGTSTILLVEDQFKEMIRKVLQELLEENFVKKIDTSELKGDNSTKKLDTTDGKQGQDHIPDGLIEETIKNIRVIQWKMEEQLKLKGIMDKITDCLKRRNDRILVILKLDYDYVSGWEETKTAFSMLGCIAGALVLNIEVNMARAKEYCSPPWEPIDYSILGLYRDIVLELTEKQQMNEDSLKICHDILEKCNPHEVCMKIFIHALYANPKRSNEDLSKLHRTLQISEHSFDHIAKKMLKFAYNDLPKDYKSCLLFLAIFPRRQRIRRSTLIGRWVVEGLITKEDWSGSVRRANRCFDTLIDRWLVHPADMGATGKVKNCVIGDLVHGFITKIARKQRIVETRLSHHLARHFSIFNDLRLRGSDGIDRFFQMLYVESGRISLIKVLDLEGCQCFGVKNQSYLKDICSKMLLLKYLSLRGTNATQLPSEINNLRELEVLDIRETFVPEYATINVLLLKLKRLLAGRAILSSGSTELSSVKVPDKIEKMLNMEVLSNVKARNSQDLKDIGKLWQLRKLGVVIEHKDTHLRNLLRAISDLHECLRSLSITLPVTEEGPSNEDFTSEVLARMVHSPKLLESLSISGTTQKGQLLRLLAKDSDLPQLTKVTLTRTRLKQADVKILTKLPKLVCVRLRDKAYIDTKLTFNKEEFQNLKCFIVEGSNMSVISFGDGATPKLEKIILCRSDILESLCGVEDLPKLKEVELKNNNKLSLFSKAKTISKVTLVGTILRQDELQILAKVPNMHCLVLKDLIYVQSQLIFNNSEFPKLNLLIIDFSTDTNISFAHGSAPKLEKIIWSFTKDMVGTLSGINNLPKLKEIEFNGDIVPNEVQKAITEHKNKPSLKHNKPENQHQSLENVQEKTGDARFPFYWKRLV